MYHLTNGSVPMQCFDFFVSKFAEIICKIGQWIRDSLRHIPIVLLNNKWRLWYRTWQLCFGKQCRLVPVVSLATDRAVFLLRLSWDLDFHLHDFFSCPKIPTQADKEESTVPMWMYMKITYKDDGYRCCLPFVLSWVSRIEKWWNREEIS